MQDCKIILGPPGCGKTTRLLTEVDTLLAAGTAPSRIAYLSFTRKATGEAIGRACERFAMTKDDFPYFKTIHALAYQQLGLAKEQVMGAQHYKQIGHKMGLAFSDYLSFEEGLPVSSKTGDAMLYLTAMARAREVPLLQQWREGNAEVDWWALKQFDDAVQGFKRSAGLIDFPDMLDLFIESCDPLDVDVVFIDEAQDLSRQQWHAVQHAASRARQVVIAGDDDQAIYEWSGADVGYFLSLDAPREVLSKSYRLPRRVHALCDKIAQRIGRRFPKQWAGRDEDGEVNYLAALHEIEWREGSYMFLVRNRYLMTDVAAFLRASGVPYMASGKSVINPDHVRGIQVWEALRAGKQVIGEDARRLYLCLRSGEGVTRGHKQLKNLADKERADMAWLREHGGLVADGIWHDALTAIPTEDREFMLAARRRGESITKTPRVQLSTIHAVKGGEADHVIVLPDMARRSYEDCERSQDSEHRVAYVAASRARKTLSILSPASYRSYGYP